MSELTKRIDALNRAMVEADCHKSLSEAVHEISCLIHRQENEGVVVEIVGQTCDPNGDYLRVRIVDGTCSGSLDGKVRLTRIQDCDDPATIVADAIPDEFCNCETSAHEKCGGAN